MLVVPVPNFELRAQDATTLMFCTHGASQLGTVRVLGVEARDTAVQSWRQLSYRSQDVTQHVSGRLRCVKPSFKNNFLHNPGGW